MRTLFDAARTGHAREPFELVARPHRETRADESRSRRAMHPVAIRRGRRPTHGEHVACSARDEETEVREEVLRESKVRALEDDMREGRRFCGGAWVPSRL